MSGIITVTLAAAVDLTYHLERVVHGRVNRARGWSRELSGKGVNVAHAVHDAGGPTRAVVALGEDASALGSADWLRPVPVGGSTRVNITFSEAGGVTTKVNAQAQPLEAADVQAVQRQTLAEMRALAADWVVIAGTVPPLSNGAGISLSGLIRAAAADGVRVAVDTSGPALEKVLVEDVATLALIKPNTHELAEAAGRPLHTIGDVAAAAAVFVDQGCETVYVSMGADGALAVTAGGTWWARAAPARTLNATGAGDASLAGFLVHAGPGTPDVPAALCGAASYGALSVSQASTLLHDLGSAPHPELIVAPDSSTPLLDPAV